MSSWFGAFLAPCSYHSYPLMEYALCEGEWIHNHCVPLSACYPLPPPPPLLTSTIPPVLCQSWGITEKGVVVQAVVLYGKRAQQEGGRTKEWPGTVEVMGSERKRKGDEKLIWSYKHHVSVAGWWEWTVLVPCSLGLSPVQCTLQW